MARQCARSISITKRHLCVANNLINKLSGAHDRETDSERQTFFLVKLGIYIVSMSLVLCWCLCLILCWCI